MKTAIILHGLTFPEDEFREDLPAESNSHWIPWLQRKLILGGMHTQTPEFPNSAHPVYEECKDLFERFDITEETLLIGHSLGGGFLLRWLSENKARVGRVILVAPWTDPGGVELPDFFDFKIDDKLVSRAKDAHMFVSYDDNKEVLDTVEIVKTKLPDVKLHEFKGKGHFTLSEMKTDKFPELLEVCLEE